MFLGHLDLYIGFLAENAEYTYHTLRVNVISNYTQSVNTGYKFRIIAFSQAQWILKFEFYVLRNILVHPVPHSNRDSLFSLGCL